MKYITGKKRVSMAKEPDEVFGPEEYDERFPKGPVIDVTPEKRQKGGIDFDSGKPLIEQILEDHELYRRDKRPETYQTAIGVAILIVIASIVLLLIISRLL